MFFLSLLNAAQSVDNGDVGPSAESLIASYAAELEVLAQVVGTQFNTESMLASLEIAINTIKDQANLQPPSETGELQQQIDTLRQEVETLPRPALGTMAQLQQAWLPWVTFDTAPEFTPPDVGTLAWDGGTTLGVQMTTNVLGRVNESGYYYIKASSVITKGDVVMFTGAVGASGVPTGAPATGLTDGSYIMGIAAESLALNAFGLVQFIGALKGIDTSTFADGDILWYNPAVAGGLTKTKPSAPNVKVQMAAVINGGSGGSGSILIRVNSGSVLGGTDSNVQFGTLANGNIIQYDSTAGYWKNVSLSTAGAVTAVTGTSPVVSSGGTSPAISLAANYGDTQNPYASKTANYFLAAPNGSAGVPTFRAIVAADIPALPYGTGTVTSVGLSMPGQFTVTNSPVTTSGTLTAAWNNQTAAYVLAGPATGVAAAPTFRALVATDVPTLNQNTTGTAANVTGVVAIANGGTGSTTAATALTALGAYPATNPNGYTSNTGTVTSVSGTGTVSGLSLSGTVTTTGNLTLGGTLAVTPSNFASQTANTVLAAPNGSAGTPTFRALVAADIPALSYVSSIGVTAPITSTGGVTPTIGITQAGTSSNGYLSSTDWNAFNNKQPSGTYVTAVTGTAPVVSSGGTTPAISMAAATSSVNGYLTSTDWSTFNNKQSVSAPVTKTADFSVAATDLWLINNKSGSTCTATLPAASSYSGRVLHFQNYQAQTLVSASSNVVPLAGGAAGTSILLASAGDSATLVSDGSNWLMTQYVPNNILLLE